MTAPEFCEGHDFAVGTLRWWASRLERGALERRTVAFPLARVKRWAAPAPAPTQEPDVGSALVVELGGARVTVPPGFDRATFAAVIDLLGARGAGR
jgi:hypothetical protein